MGAVTGVLLADPRSLPAGLAAGSVAAFGSTAGGGVAFGWLAVIGSTPGGSFAFALGIRPGARGLALGPIPGRLAGGSVIVRFCIAFPEL